MIFGFVIKDPSAENLTERKILDYVNQKVDDDAKKLRGGVHFIDAFPLTPSAKVKRFIVKRIAQNYKDSEIKMF